MSDHTAIPGESLPPDFSQTTAEDRIRRWAEWLEVCEQFLLAGLRREIGPDGDLEAAYRTWIAGKREEHDRMILHLMTELQRRERAHAR